MHATLASRDVVGFTLSRMNVVWLFYISTPDCSTVSSNIVLLDLQVSLGWFPPSVLQWTTWLSGPPKFLSILSSPLLAWIHICSLSFPVFKDQLLQILWILQNSEHAFFHQPSRSVWEMVCLTFLPYLGTWIPRVQDLCLIPEVPFYLDGPGGLKEFAKQRLRENGHMVIVVAEGAGQELIAETMGSLDKLSDASGNRLLLDVGLWLSQNLKVCTLDRPVISLLASKLSHPSVMDKTNIH